MQNKGLYTLLFFKNIFKNIVPFDYNFLFFAEMIGKHLISWFIDLFISLPFEIIASSKESRIVLQSLLNLLN